MDEIDNQILAELQANSRASNTEIAKKLSVSEGTIRKRIENLLQQGIIAKFSAILSTKSGFMAFVFIKTDTRMPTTSIVKRIKEIPGTDIIYETAGHQDIVIRVAMPSAEAFNDFIERIRAVDGVVETESLTVLKVS